MPSPVERFYLVFSLAQAMANKETERCFMNHSAPSANPYRTMPCLTGTGPRLAQPYRTEPDRTRAYPAN